MFFTPTPAHLALGLAFVLGACARTDSAPASHSSSSSNPPIAAGSSGATMKPNPVHEMRVALTVDAYDAAFRFYRDGLKFKVLESWERPDGKGVILDAHRATLEIVSTAQADTIDRLEVGKRIAGPVRLGLDVESTEAMAQAFVAAGGERIAGPVATPWSPKTFRLRAPDGMQYTLFTDQGAKSGGEPARQLRMALTVEKFEEALRFYRDTFGLPVITSWSEPSGSGAIFDAGHATLELLSKDMAESVDRIEVGRRVAGPVRVALDVKDSAAVGELLTNGGAQLLGGPVLTPWKDKNVRVRAPDGMQYTLFTKHAP
ncbi:VOC family protein [Pendulispora albinea]|uniref:VOC family protein n=1 Tax=Pendulispora albinea TaxID=2741071 RepID=A0ABZ2M0J7_9BACT